VQQHEPLPALRLRRWEFRSTAQYTCPEGAHPDLEIAWNEVGLTDYHIGSQTHTLGPGAVMRVPAQVGHATGFRGASRATSIHLGSSVLARAGEVTGRREPGPGHLSGKPTQVSFKLTPYVEVDGAVDGVKGLLLVDTGASLGGVEQGVLAATGLNNPQIEGYYLSAGVGTFWSGYAMVGSMSVGPYTVKRITMYTMPDGTLSTATNKTLATLPYGFMEHFLVTLDFANTTLRLDPGQGEDLKDSFTLYGYGLSLSVNSSGPVTITRVVPGSPADKAGLKVGDGVQKIGGNATQQVPPDQRIGLVLTSGAGVSNPFVVEQGSAAPATLTLVSAPVFESFAP